MSSEDIHPSNLRECCICYESKILDCFVGYSCNHNTVCLTCFFNQNYPITNSSIFTCPLCRTETNYNNLRYNLNTCSWSYKKKKDGDDRKISKIIYFDQSDNNNILYEKIRKYITTVKNEQNTKKILRSILILYNSIEQDIKHPILFTIDQVENLLTIMKDRDMNNWDEYGYMFYNLFVSMCRYPWKVDVALGSHGVCYHGNLGDCPGSLNKLCWIITNNQEYLTANKAYF
jgi:hypothetical protein